MGRSPCCDKGLGLKKGPWTPEEDIMLVSYIQEHGPGNWRAVPSNTGLKRCSKSCRLRWTNYLRPGIKRGSFTDHEEKMIIQLQALLGNKWAAIASYLPERTDNDIKNYWNTHLRKKLKKLQTGLSDNSRDGLSSSSPSSSSSLSMSRGQWEKRLQTDINMAKQALHQALSLDTTTTTPSCLVSSDHHHHHHHHQPSSSSSSSTTYASSTENIAKLLKGWMKKDSPKPQSSSSQHSFNNTSLTELTESTSSGGAPKNGGGIDLSEAFESLFGFESFDRSRSMSPEASFFQGESKPDLGAQLPFSMLENWLFDDHQVHVHGKEQDLTNFSFGESEDLF